MGKPASADGEVASTLDLATVEAAGRRIAPHVLRTPVLRRRPRGAAVELLFKAECLQPTGAFKLRGAFSLMCTLPPDIRGVVAHSSGNHAQAVARAARTLGMRAVIVMPEDAPALKRRRVEEDGAEVVTVGNDSEERRLRAESLARDEGLIPVPPYDDLLVAAGQGTAALELLDEVGELQRFYAPVSGGGLMAGCATVVAARCPAAEIVGVEPADGDDTLRSLAAGERREVPPPRTIADGLRVRTPGALTFPVLQRHVDRIALVTDGELRAAMAWAAEELRLVLEPSGAASLAVALREAQPQEPSATGGRGAPRSPDDAPDDARGATLDAPADGRLPRWGVLLSGGNVDGADLVAALSSGGGGAAA